MAILTTAEVRQHVETDLVDGALERLIDDADQEIIDRLGALSSETEVLDGGGALLHLSRKASAISSAVERIDETDYTLAASDYGLLGDGRRVERRQGSGYPASLWRGRVTVAYTPADETATRKRLLADLVKLAAVYQATSGLSVGGTRVDHVDYLKERERLILGGRRNRRMHLA